MGRRFFTTEFKVEAVRLVRERGVRISQAAQDLGIHQNVLLADRPRNQMPTRVQGARLFSSNSVAGIESETYFLDL